MNKDHISQSRLSGLIRAEYQRLMCYAFYRLGSEEDAQDAVQDVFLKMSNIMSEKKSEGIVNLKNYLYRALSNLCTTRVSRKHRVQNVSIDSCFDLAETNEESSEEEFLRIRRLLATLPEEQAEVIRLRIYGNNTFAEIAEILAIPLPTVKSRFIYGLTKIKRSIEKDNGCI